MKGSTTFRKRWLVLLVAICMAMAIPAAYAVVKNVTVVDAQGNSLANTKVTIVFPDGTEVAEETDDDGILIYDFPGDGEYTVNYPGGQMGVSVAGGRPGLWIGVGLGAATAIGLLVASDSDNNSSSSSPGTGDTGGGSGSGGSVLGECFATVHTVTTSVVSNPGGHPVDGFDGDWETFCPSTTVVNFTQRSGPNPADPPWTCTLDSSGTCIAPPTICTWGGFNTTCSLNSQIDINGLWSGTMSAGLDGALPGGQSIVLSFTSS